MHAFLRLENQRGIRLSGLHEGPIDMIQAANRVLTSRGVSDQNQGDNTQAAAPTFEAERVANPRATMQALSYGRHRAGRYAEQSSQSDENCRSGTPLLAATNVLTGSASVLSYYETWSSSLVKCQTVLGLDS
jgi:hypothetical protein